MRGISLLSRPTADIIRNIGKIHRQEIRFIIEPCGPTKFHVKQIYPATSRSGTVYTVSIGAAQLCTCGSREICIHILYVMIRYFGVPKNSELLYQRSLSDREVNSLLERRYIRRARMHYQQENRQSSPNRNHSQNNNHQNHQHNVPTSVYVPTYQPPQKKVNRLNISENDLYPICYDSLFDCPLEEVAWCSYGCGGNFHVKCVQEWIYSQNADGKPGSCPLCRIQMDDPDTSVAPNQKEFDKFHQQQLLQKQNQPNETPSNNNNLLHSNDTCASSNVTKYFESLVQRNEDTNNNSNNNNNFNYINNNASINNNRNNSSDNNDNNNNNLNSNENTRNNNEDGDSYLAMLRRELESSSQSHARLQQQIENHKRLNSQIHNNIINNNRNNDDDETMQMSSLQAQISEIDEFLTAARTELNNEMARLKEHQRRVQASIEAQIKAGARARSGLKDSRGRNVEPVLKVRVPIFDPLTATTTASQQQQPKQLPRMIDSASINESTRRGQARSLLNRSTDDNSNDNNNSNNVAAVNNDNDSGRSESPTSISDDHLKRSRVIVTAKPKMAQRVVHRAESPTSVSLAASEPIAQIQIPTSASLSQVESIQKNLLPAIQEAVPQEKNEASSSSPTVSNFGASLLQSPPKTSSPVIARPSSSQSPSILSPATVAAANSASSIPPRSSLTQLSQIAAPKQLIRPSPSLHSNSSSILLDSLADQPPLSDNSPSLADNSPLLSDNSLPSVSPASLADQSSLSSKCPLLSNNSPSSFLALPASPPSPINISPLVSSDSPSLSDNSPSQSSKSPLFSNNSPSSFLALPASPPSLSSNLPSAAGCSPFVSASISAASPSDASAEAASSSPAAESGHHSRLDSLIDELCSLESYIEQQPAAPCPHHRYASLHQQPRLAHSSLSPIPSSKPNAEAAESEPKKRIKAPVTAKTINLNDTFNDLTAPRGNITDGLTLAQQHARENELRLQRTLNPTLTPKGLGAKRAAKSRLQAKRGQNSQAVMQKRNKNQSRLGWSS